MPSLGDRFNDESKKRGKALGKLIGTFEVATTVPFTVYIDGSNTAVDAWSVPGLSYSVGTTGMYLLRQGQLPLCIPTA